MPNRKAQIKKLSDKNEQFRLQRERLEHFSHDLLLRLRMLISEMEGDLKVLKIKNLDKKVWKIFAKLWGQLIEIAKHLDSGKSYQSAQAVIDLVKTRPHKAIVENLEFLIQHHLKQTEVNFEPGPLLQPVQVRSLKLLKALADYLEKYIQDNPLLNYPGSNPPPPLEIQEPQEEKVAPPGSEGATFIPPVQKK